MKKKSKFQQRLEIAAKRHIEESGKTPGTQSQSAQLPRGWKSLEDEKPPYYAPITISVINKGMFHDWHRVSNGDEDWYCPNDGHNKTIIPEAEVISWRPPEGVEYPTYEPMTTDDLPLFTTRDLYDIIDTFTGYKMPVDEEQEHVSIGYNIALRQAIVYIRQIIEDKTPRITECPKTRSEVHEPKWNVGRTSGEVRCMICGVLQIDHD